jgi:hypothetical protein
MGTKSRGAIARLTSHQDSQLSCTFPLSFTPPRLDYACFTLPLVWREGEVFSKPNSLLDWFFTNPSTVIEKIRDVLIERYCKRNIAENKLTEKNEHEDNLSG